MVFIPTTRMFGKMIGETHGFRSTALRFGLFCIVIGCILVQPAAAQTLEEDLNVAPTAQLAGLPVTPLTLLVARIIRGFLGLLGLVAVGLVIYGGVLWMTAGGSEDKIVTAKKVLVNAAIGLLIILLSFAIVQFVLSKMLAAIAPPGEATGSAVGAGGVGFEGGADLGKIIESHYPARNEKDVPRDVALMVTFLEPMDLKTLVFESAGDADNQFGNMVDTNNDGTPDKAFDTIKSDNVRIFQTKFGETARLKDADATVAVINTKSGAFQKQTLIIGPITLLGSSQEPISYTVRLTGEVKRANGQSAFFSAQGYSWAFEVGTTIDKASPHITGVYPKDKAEGVFKNAVVTVNFDKPMHPLPIVDPSIGGLTVTAGGGVVGGAWSLENNFKTAEFTPALSCGTNACGDAMFCLPSKATVGVTATAAVIDAAKGAPKGILSSGLVSTTGNSLDGTGDGVAEGQPKDNFSWSFVTSDVSDTKGPAIASITPEIEGVAANLTDPVVIQFSETLRFSTLSSGITLAQPQGKEQWITRAGEDIETGDPPETVSRVLLKHAPFLEKSDYTPQINEKLQDRQQNCFFPAIGIGVSGEQCVGEPYCCEGVASATTCE